MTILRIAAVIAGSFFLLWRAIPLALTRWMPFGRIEVIPTVDHRFPAGALAGLLVVAPALLAWFGGGPKTLGLIHTAKTGAWAVLGTGLLLTAMPLVSLAQGASRADAAAAMGVVTPIQFLAYSFVTAWLVDGFREELFYRGFVQGYVFRAVQGSWGILAPVLFFAFVHSGKDGPWLIRLTGALPPLIPGLLFATLFRESGSLVPGILAHGAGNAVITGLTGLSLYAPRAYPVAAAITSLAGFALVISQRDLAWQGWLSLRAGLSDRFTAGFAGGATAFLVLAVAYLVIIRSFPRHW